MSIGERISTARKARNVSQNDLAKALGVTRQAVSKWENDLSSPDTLNLIRLADQLDADLLYLATGKQTVESEPVIIKTTETVEKIVEVPVEKVVEVEKIVEKVIEKTVVRRVFRYKYIRNSLEYLLIGAVCFIAGLLLGLIF